MAILGKVNHQTVKGTKVRDKVSGEVGRVERVYAWGRGLEVKIWLLDSDAYVWRMVDAEEVDVIDNAEYDQACFEWELAHQCDAPTQDGGK